MTSTTLAASCGLKSEKNEVLLRRISACLAGKKKEAIYREGSSSDESNDEEFGEAEEAEEDDDWEAEEDDDWEAGQLRGTVL